MIDKMDRNMIITLKLKGKSNRWIERETKVDRKTVARYWNEYKRLTEKLEQDADKREIQEKIANGMKYDTTSRRPVKYTKEMDEALNIIMESETAKARYLGANNKQKLSNKQIHRLLQNDGYDIGISTISNKVREKRNKIYEGYIRQEYEYGDRVEYDFGEVKLVIGGIVGKYYMVVFGSPRSKFRWAYLYKNQKKDVFLDSHVRFLDMLGGSYLEIIYDNMRNVVSRFIGRGEKDLNKELVSMSTYYGFSPNVTNCFSGNEKGYVESSVKAVRKEVFAVRYRFENIEEAEEYLETELQRINIGSSIEEEKKFLLPWKPPLELSRMTEQRVDKYSFVRIDNNFYSVPDYLVKKKVMVRNYVNEVVIYVGMDEVCRHKKKDGYGEMSVNIFHYLDTLAKKPGAIRNSKALKSEAELKAVFDRHYINDARKFIDILRGNQDKPMDEILSILCANEEGYVNDRTEEAGSNVLRYTKDQLRITSDFFSKKKVV